MGRQTGDFETTVRGIPCQVKVDSCLIEPAQGRSASNDLDCYGYAEIEFTLLDRKGYPAPWLQDKMTWQDTDKLHKEIIKRSIH